MRKTIKILSLFFLIFLISPIYLSFGSETGEKKVLVNGHIADTLSPGVNKKDAEISLKMVLDKLTKNGPYIVDNIVFPSTEAALTEIKEGRVDIVTLTSIGYLEIKDKIDMTPMVVPTLGRDPLDEYLLLVKKSRDINSLGKLKNKKLIIIKGHMGTISLMWLNTLLFRQNLPESSLFFNFIKEVDNGSHVVLPVFFEQADTCIIPSSIYETLVELNPQLSKQLIALHKSPEFLGMVTCFHNRLDKKTMNFLLDFTVNLDSDPEGKQYLTIFHLKKTYRFEPEYLNSIEQLFHEYKRTGK